MPALRDILKRLAQRVGLRRSAEARMHPMLRSFAIGRSTYWDGVPEVYGSVPASAGPALTIGSYCSIARKVAIFVGSEHRIDWVTSFPLSMAFGTEAAMADAARSKGPVVIGNDVWLGYGSTVLSGVTIGDGAVVGARSVVTKDVPPYAIVAGNPAKLIRYRFPEDSIKRLLQIRWWDWPVETIRRAAPLLQSTDLARFFDFAEGVSRSPQATPR